MPRAASTRSGGISGSCVAFFRWSSRGCEPSRLRPAGDRDGASERALEALSRQILLDARNVRIAAALLVIRDQRLVPVEDAAQLGDGLVGDVHAQVEPRVRLLSIDEDARGRLAFLLPARIA